MYENSSNKMLSIFLFAIFNPFCPSVNGMLFSEHTPLLPEICCFVQFFLVQMSLITIWRFVIRTMYWLSQVLTESKYYGPNTAAEAVSKIFKPEERPQKIILDIGAGTGLVAEEVTCIYCLVWCFWRHANMILVYCLHVPQKIVFFEIFIYILDCWLKVDSINQSRLSKET